MKCNRVANLIDAFIDAELDPVHSLEVESHLRECRRCARTVATRKQLLQALHAQLPRYTAPAELRQRIAAKTPTPTRFTFRPLALAASVALFVALATWFAAQHLVTPKPDPNAQLAAAVEASHLRSLLPGGGGDHLLDVPSSDHHTVKPWFAGKLPYSPQVENFGAQGFPLRGGRLDVLQNQPVATLIYQRRQHIINVYLWPTNDYDSPPQSLHTQSGHNLLHFTANRTTYWLISDLNPKELQSLATLLQHPPTPPPATQP